MEGAARLVASIILGQQVYLPFQFVFDITFRRYNQSGTTIENERYRTLHRTSTAINSFRVWDRDMEKMPVCIKVVYSKYHCWGFIY